jgi:hypothetical protein
MPPQKLSCPVASGTDGIRHVPSSEHCGMFSTGDASIGGEMCNNVDVARCTNGSAGESTCFFDVESL